MTDRRIRNSSISAFTNCPRSWMLSYWMNLEKVYGLRVKPSASDIGTAFHLGVEAFSNKLDPVQAIYRAFYGVPATKEAKKIDGLVDQIQPGADLKKFTDSCVTLPTIMINNFIEWQASSGMGMGETIIGVEKAVEGKIGLFLGDEVTLFGKIDQLTKLDNGDLIVDDYKSVQNLESDLALHQNRQLLNYCMLVWIGTGTMPVMARHIQAKRWKRTKPGLDWSDSFRINTVRINEKMLQVHWIHLSSIITDMVGMMQKLDAAKAAGEDPAHHFLVPPNPDKNCNWICSFNDICPMMDDPNADWTALLADEYRQRDKDGN